MAGFVYGEREGERETVETARREQDFFCQADIDFGKIFLRKKKSEFNLLMWSYVLFCWLKLAISPKSHKNDFVYACRNFAKGR